MATKKKRPAKARKVAATRKPAVKRRRRKATGGSVVLRRRIGGKTRTVYSNPRRRRRANRNPGLSVRGIVGSIAPALGTTAGVAGGLFLSKQVDNLLARVGAIGDNQWVRAAAKLAVAVGVGAAVSHRLRRGNRLVSRIGEGIAVGGVIAAVKDAVPQAGAFLAAYDNHPALGSYAESPRLNSGLSAHPAGMAAYQPQDAGAGYR